MCELIDEFRKYVEKTRNKIEAIKAGLVLGDGLYAEIPQMIKEVESDLEELINQAKELISEEASKFCADFSAFSSIIFYLQIDLKALKYRFAVRLTP